MCACMTAHSGRDPRSGGLESEVTSLTPLIVSRFSPAVLNSKPPKQIAPVFCLVKAGPLHRMCQMPRVWQMFEKYIQKYFFEENIINAPDLSKLRSCHYVLNLQLLSQSFESEKNIFEYSITNCPFLSPVLN